MNLQTFGGRRFILVLGANAVTSFLQYTGHLDPSGSTYLAVVIATVGAYIAGNVSESNTATKFGSTNANPTP
jgi:hypothetical protein